MILPRPREHNFSLCVARACVQNSKAENFLFVSLLVGLACSLALTKRQRFFDKWRFRVGKRKKRGAPGSIVMYIHTHVSSGLSLFWMKQRVCALTTAEKSNDPVRCVCCTCRAETTSTASLRTLRYNARGAIGLLLFI